MMTSLWRTAKWASLPREPWVPPVIWIVAALVLLAWSLSGQGFLTFYQAL